MASRKETVASKSVENENMIWAPNLATRQKVKFWLDCLQVVTVVGGVAVVAITYASYKKQEEARIYEQNARAAEQLQQAKAQHRTAIREARKPFDERQLQIYIETASNLAHLAVSDNDAHAETRFWELYYGELPFVESTGPNSVASILNEFCQIKFGADKCSRIPDEKQRTAGSPRQIAIDMSQKASKEIRMKWDQEER